MWVLDRYFGHLFLVKTNYFNYEHQPHLFPHTTGLMQNTFNRSQIKNIWLDKALFSIKVSIGGQKHKSILFPYTRFKWKLLRDKLFFLTSKWEKVILLYIFQHFYIESDWSNGSSMKKICYNFNLGLRHQKQDSCTRIS